MTKRSADKKSHTPQFAIKLIVAVGIGFIISILLSFCIYFIIQSYTLDVDFTDNEIMYYCWASITVYILSR